MARTPEGKVKDDIKKWLKARGAYWYMPSQNGMGVVGVPDFICCIGGRFVGIEAKAPGKRGNTTPNQEHQIAAIHKAGGAAIVVDDAAQLDVLDSKERE